MVKLCEQTSKIFKGACYVCGKKGHRKQNCPQKTEKTTGNKTKFKGNCSVCGKIGNKDANCWNKKENASERPTNWKGKAKVEGQE